MAGRLADRRRPGGDGAGERRDGRALERRFDRRRVAGAGISRRDPGGGRHSGNRRRSDLDSGRRKHGRGTRGGRELYLPSELPKMCDTIRKTTKTCLAFKLFAGGRTSSSPEEVSDVFEYVFGHIKPTDAVVVGMYPRFSDQITENVALVKKYG